MNPWGRTAIFSTLLLPRLLTAQSHLLSPPSGGLQRPLSPPAASAAVPFGNQRSSGQGSAVPLASIATPEPTAAVPLSSAAMQTFHDPSWKISFDYPRDWTFTRHDGEISTFRLDARTAPRRTSLRAVAAIPENPFPASTFSGAYVYLSVTPRSTEVGCARQATAAAATTPLGSGATPGVAGSSQLHVRRAARPEVADFGGIPFTHGHDEQKNICVTQRDEIYTTLHRGACYRFDLAINAFCGGEVSGVKDVTETELEQVRARMQAILSTVRFDTK